MGGQFEVKDRATKKYYSIAGMMVAVNDGTGLQYLLTDHLGSTVAVTNQSGTLTSQQRYLPFGAARTIPNSPILGTDFTYTGQRKLDDGMGGIMDYKARFYSPVLGRFLQPDTIIPDQFNPQSWNRFSYVMNNPVRFTDPSGHACVDGTSYCVDPVTRKKSGSLTKYNDIYTGGRRDEGGCDDYFCRMNLKDNEETDDESYDSLDVGYLLENNPNFNPFITTTSLEAGDYPFSELERYDVAFLQLYQSLGIDIDYYAKRRLPNPLTVDQVPAPLQIRILGPSKSIELSIFLDEMGLASGNQMNYEPNYVFSLMSQNPRVLLNAINRYNTEVAPLTEHLYDLKPPGAD